MYAKYSPLRVTASFVSSVMLTYVLSHGSRMDDMREVPKSLLTVIPLCLNRGNRMHHSSRPEEIDMTGQSNYLIRVVGNVSVDWIDYFDISIMVHASRGASAISTICAHGADQASLAGLLDRLYTFGYPLVYVEFLGKSSP